MKINSHPREIYREREVSQGKTIKLKTQRHKMPLHLSHRQFVALAEQDLFEQRIHSFDIFPKTKEQAALFMKLLKET